MPVQSRRVRAFKRWMKWQGIECSDAVELVETSGGEFSVVTRCSLFAEDVVAAIPKRACLTAKNSGAREVIEDAGFAGCLALVVALMYEQSLGHLSLWEPYLNLLPRCECLPLVWTMDEVDTLLVGTELHGVVKQDKALVIEDWAECIQPLLISETLDPKFFSVKQYFAAKTLITSRSFQIDDHHGLGMVPLADLFNHRTASESMHFTSLSKEDSLLLSSGTHSELFQLIIVKDVLPHSEVYSTYGSLGNAALLHIYGFTEPHNPFDIVNIDIGLVLKWCSSTFSPRYTRHRLSLWRKFNESGCVSHNLGYFEVTSDGVPQTELLLLLYIILLPEEEYIKLDNDLFLQGDVKWPWLNKLSLGDSSEICGDLLLTRGVREALCSLADLREVGYGSNTLEDDIRMAGRCCSQRERKLFHSFMLRVSERSILKRLKIFAGS